MESLRTGSREEVSDFGNLLPKEMGTDAEQLKNHR